MHYRIPTLVGVLVLGSSAFALAQSPAPMMSSAPMMSPAPMMSAGGAMMPMAPAGAVTVKLGAQNGSGETGTAVLTQVGPDVKVTATMTGGGTAMQPIHIHDGSCAKLDPKPKYPLTTIEDGKSTTLLKGMKLTELENGMYAINVHKSTTDIPAYVSCGDIPKMKAM